jgi:DNA-binding Lrp family transcriptional regulator
MSAITIESRIMLSHFPITEGFMMVGFVVIVCLENMEKTGDFVETVTLDDVFGVFAAVDGPVITSADVADALGCTPDTARNKLAELHREGRINQRKTAGRIVWWRSDDVLDPETALRRLSREVGEAIVVGDTAYEDGDAHALSAADETEPAEDESDE